MNLDPDAAAQAEAVIEEFEENVEERDTLNWLLDDEVRLITFEFLREMAIISHGENSPMISEFAIDRASNAIPGLERGTTREAMTEFLRICDEAEEDAVEEFTFPPGSDPEPPRAEPATEPPRAETASQQEPERR